MPIDQLVQNFGLPIGLLLYFIWRDYQTNREYNQYIKDIAQKTADAINRSTDVDTKMLSVIERLEKRLDNGRNI